MKKKSSFLYRKIPLNWKKVIITALGIIIVAASAPLGAMLAISMLWIGEKLDTYFIQLFKSFM
jgi:hypothetical protein